jgi:RNA polymerase sigma-70 factor (ECF subfamily)
MNDNGILAEIYEGLRRFAGAVSSLPADPDDLVQEAVLRTLRRGPLSDLHEPATYLRRVILNLARSEHRNSMSRARLLLRARPLTTHVDTYPSDFTDLSALTPEQRAVLFLRFVENQPAAAIATTLSMSEPAVRARMSRAMKALRLDLERSSVDGHD